MTATYPKIAYVTAGAAGMYCGSCMHDNTLVRALIRLGVDAQLIPMYTPLRTDETAVTIDRVFFGGINVYLEQRLPLFRRLPAWTCAWLDHPRLLRWATRRGVETDSSQLGAMTVSMLRGERGFQRREVRRLVRYLADELRPDVVILTNFLVAGFLPTLKKAAPRIKTVVTLQGDDIFLDGMIEPFRKQALAELRSLIPAADHFLAHSAYYRDYMANLLDLPGERMFVTRLGIDISGYDSPRPPRADDDPPTVGYLARIDRAKGLHTLVDAFIELRRLPGCEDARLKIAGYLGPDKQRYLAEQETRLQEHGAGEAYVFVGELTRAEKIAYLKSVDVLSVPTQWPDPKGLYVLEALAAGTPVVQPRHGAFPEILEATGGGPLFEPGDAADLARQLNTLLMDRPAAQQIGAVGQRAIAANYTSERAAREMLERLR